MQKTLSYFVKLLDRDFTEFCNRKLQEIGLTLGLMYFVLYIGRHPGCSPGQLSEDIRFDGGHTARSLDKLERDGFILREKNPQDKRAYRLQLTDKGLDALQSIRGLLVEWDEFKCVGISSEERMELLRIMAKLAEQKECNKFERKDL